MQNASLASYLNRHWPVTFVNEVTASGKCALFSSSANILRVFDCRQKSAMISLHSDGHHSAQPKGSCMHKERGTHADPLAVLLELTLRGSTCPPI